MSGAETHWALTPVGPRQSRALATEIINGTLFAEIVVEGGAGIRQRTGRKNAQLAAS